MGRKGKPVAIGKLEAYVADQQRNSQGFPLPAVASPTGKRVAVVGSGPAGLTAAELIRCAGHEVVVYEAWPEPGGILRYGIPHFKLGKQVVDEKVEFLRRRLGVPFITNTMVGRDLSLDDLRRRFNAVLLAHGAGCGVELGVEGEYLAGVYQATEFLVRGNLAPEERPPWLGDPLPPARHLVVIGGGDTSMDCVRTGLRLGCERVTLLYRRTEAEMLGREEERAFAKEEGVDFRFLATPVRLLDDGHGGVAAVECVGMELGEADPTGRPAARPVPGSEFVLEADMVVVAVGYVGDPELATQQPGLRLAGANLLELADPETGATTLPGVFAAGDSVNGADLVVTAIASARRAAAAILAQLAG